MIQISDVVFVRSATGQDGPSPFLRDGLPQILLAGRSNVGKSSWLNCLVQRKLMARVSTVPGKTVCVNYYRVDFCLRKCDGRENSGHWGRRSFYLVDLPGYGYARVSQGERIRWGHMMSAFFFDISAVVLAFLIVDARHKPTQEDQEMASLFRTLSIPFTVVANKQDKIGSVGAIACQSVIRESLSLGVEQDLTCGSAETGCGRTILLGKIWEAVVGSACRFQ